MEWRDMIFMVRHGLEMGYLAGWHSSWLDGLSIMEQLTAWQRASRDGIVYILCPLLDLI
jgi:hypothetical protein